VRKPQNSPLKFVRATPEDQPMLRSEMIPVHNE
jgi:hypothetical protein